MSKTTSIIIAVIIIGATWYYTSYDPVSPSDLTQNKVSNTLVENSVIKDGVQYITIIARGGYSPKLSTAKEGIITKLIIKTNGTYDCSASLVIRSLSYRGMLPSTGETVIDVGTPNKGDVLQGTCGMGMYNFSIGFN